MTNAHFDELFGGPARSADERLTARHMDLAASIQAVTDGSCGLTAGLPPRRAPTICLAGGVALNCVANGKVLRRALKRIWIQPAAGDAGGAVRAALAAYHQHLQQPRGAPAAMDGMCGSYLGPAFDDDDAAARLTAAGARVERLSDHAVIERAAQDLAAGQAIGWFQGRMEFGPRALGNRSILADPRSATMQSVLNLKVKYRESFRPFAPSVLRERVQDWFELDADSPYMLLVADVVERRRRRMTAGEEALFGIDKLNVPRSEIPAVTHVDYSARVRPCTPRPTPFTLISAFERLTGCPVVVNTSFNVRGSPRAHRRTFGVYGRS